jgi:hypothetical protein
MTDDLRALAARLIATSPYAMPLDEAKALTAARHARLRAQRSPPAKVEPDFTPQPLPIVDSPLEFGREFWARKSGTDKPRKAKPKKSPGRRPVGGGLDGRHGRFSVIDGEGGDNDPGTPR